MTRIHRLAANQLVERINVMRQTLDAFKSGAAQTVGSDSFRTHFIQSGDIYDIRCTGVTFNNTSVLIAFTPADASVSSTSLVYRMLVAYQDSDGIVMPAGSHFDGLQRQKPTADGVQQWYLYLEGPGSGSLAWIDLKFYFFASGAGTFSVALV